MYTGVGGTLQGRGSVGGVEYEPGRVHGFLAFEWRPWPSWSVVAETNAASRLVANIQGYPSVHWMLDVTAKHPLGDSCALTLGFTENLLSQLSTTDFAVYAAFTVRR